VLLGYIIAALVFWFISLNKQNAQMTTYKIERLSIISATYNADLQKIEADDKRKLAQYIGEGVTFLVFIMAGAIFIFRAVRRQLRETREQQNFMMAITHELKTPIAVAKLNLETLQKRALTDQQQQRLIHTSLLEANRMDDLCNNLLLSSQLESKVYRMVLEEINGTSLLEEILVEFKQRYPDLSIHQSLQPDSFIMADSFLLKMVLHNLLDNVVKYAGKKPLIVELEGQGNKYLLKIIDDGPGIPDAEKLKIFDKFYRVGNAATKTAKGTGLGLYLCKRIVETHKGTIDVTDAVGGGSVFTISLPQAVNI
jgi:signal transduction histidine kinase